MSGFLEEFTTDIDVGSARVHSASSHEAAFDEFVGVTAENFAVLAGTRLSLVGIHDKITRSMKYFVSSR
jgi:hypothetical protein